MEMIKVKQTNKQILHRVPWSKSCKLTHLLQHMVKTKHLHTEVWSLQNKNVRETDYQRSSWADILLTCIGRIGQKGFQQMHFARKVLSYTPDVHGSSMLVFQLLTFSFLSNAARD